MIRLPEINDENETAFREDTYERVHKFLSAHLTDPDYSKIIEYYKSGTELDGKKIEKVLIGNKAALEIAIEEIGEITKDSVKSEFERLYKNFCKRDFGMHWAEMIGITVCPYCNRSYIFTSSKKGTRPQYDHYFPKSKYPYLALSMYNLIPCCSICNSLKSDTDTYITPIVYPYAESFGTQASFSAGVAGDEINSWLGVSSKYQIEIKYAASIDAKLEDRIKKSEKLFHLRDLYGKHSDFVRDILRTAYIYGDDYFEGLLEQYPDLFHSEAEARNFVFFNYLDERDWGNRVLAKLTHDIYNEGQV